MIDLHKIEGIDTEFKSIFISDLKKTAVAFANTQGGKIYVGVLDDGTVVGVENADSTARQITDSFRSSIKPDITRFIRVTVEMIEGKNIVVAEIERGANLPYYIADRGLKPTGVYVRVGSASVPATDEHIRQMVKSTDGDSYTNSRSLVQELTFERTQREFDEKHIIFSDIQKQTLGVVDKNGLFTNLGLLLSEQCMHTTKIAVFEGETKAIFKSRKEFSGSLIQQLYDIIEYLDFFNLVHAEIGNLRRTETRDYPVDAIREAILNALTHREYGLSASTFVNVYDDRMEFLTVGGLVQGITLPAIMSGVSYSRNAALANIFYRLELVEAYGTGIMRIMGDYEKQRRKPEIDVTDSSFSLTLPNMRLANKASESDNNGQEKVVLDLIERNGHVTVDVLATALNLGRTRCYAILKKMQSEGIIQAVKNGRKIEYC